MWPIYDTMSCYVSIHDIYMWHHTNYKKIYWNEIKIIKSTISNSDRMELVLTSRKQFLD